MAQLPGGEVTMLFTDIEGSTALLQELGIDAYVEALEDHRRLLREAGMARSGVEVEMQGDSFHFAFADPVPAVLAAADAQRALAGHAWSTKPMRVRMGLHSGTPVISGGLYAGIDVHAAARLMSAGHGGQILLSGRTASLVADHLPEHLGLRALGEHHLKDLAAPQDVFQLLVDGLQDAFAPLKSLAKGVSDLPAPATRLVGRETELGEVLELLARDDLRLLTLVGPGGTGKTHLALEAARAAADGFDAAYFVNLAPLRDPDLVVETIARTVDAKERPGQSLTETLAAHFGEARVLILLDNFEHVARSAPKLGELLCATAGVKLLVTSREPARLSAEREYEVPPLRIDEAVRLFVERAQATRAGYVADDLALVKEICVRLDALPLAIELAAARIKLFTERELLERLRDRFRLLRGGPRDRDERQRTLEATIDWSYDLLPEAEQTLFRRLAVFMGGRTLQAIEQVCDPSGAVDALDCVASLVDKSLLRRSDGAEAHPRFEMLETVQAYAALRLEQSGERDATQRRHAEFFLALAETAADAMRGPEQARWINLLEAEHDNLRAALTWCMQGGDPLLGMHLAVRLWRFWIARGHLAEGRRWLEAALASGPPESRRASVLRGIAMVAQEQGDINRVVEAANAALELERAEGDQIGIGFALGQLAAAVGTQGDLPTAKRLCREAAETASACGARRQLAAALLMLGDFARLEGELTEADGHLVEALAAYVELGDSMGEALVVLAQAEVARERAAPRLALSLLDRSAELGISDGSVPCLLDVLDAYGRLFVLFDEHEAAAQLLSARESVGKQIGYGFTQWPQDAADRAAVVEAIRASLGDERFRLAWTEGSQMAVEQALTFAVMRGRGHADSD